MKKLFKNLKKIVIFILIIIVAMLCLYIFINHNKLGISDNKKVDTTLIANEFKNVSELATYKYNYTDVLYYKDSNEFKGITLPFTQKSFLVKFSGCIKAGVDLSTADIKVDGNKESVTVTLSSSKVLDNVIDSDNITILDEESALFNKVESQEILDELDKKKKSVEEQLLKDDFLKKSDENTKVLLEGILKGMGFKTINIEFK